MKRLMLIAMLQAPVVAAEPYLLSADEWASPRDGVSVARLPAVAAAVRDQMQSPGARIQLRYPGGEEGVLWVQELRSWLISLGVPSERIELYPGSARGDVMELSVRPGP